MSSGLHNNRYLRRGSTVRSLPLLTTRLQSSTYSYDTKISQNTSHGPTTTISKPRSSFIEKRALTMPKRKRDMTKNRMDISNLLNSTSDSRNASNESHSQLFSSVPYAHTNGEPAVKTALSQVRRINIWEVLPGDVDATIARHIRSSSYNNALMFAKQSARQGHAMAEALNYRLVLNDVYKEDMNDWITIFGDSIRHLDISRLKKTKLPSNFKDLPRLKKAEIFGTKRHYNTVKCSPRLKNLRVVLSRNAVWDDLVEVCTTLPLEELCLDCGLNDYCCRRKVSVDQLFSLADACPKVTKLDMKCSCEHSKSFWPFVVSLKSLKYLKLYRKVEDEAMDFLRKLEEVEFCEQSIPIRHILPISHNITAVTQLRRAKKDTVATLELFPRLRKLHMAVVDGAEKVLPKVVERVEVLDLSWGYDDFYDDEEDSEYGDGSMNFDSEVTDLYRPDPEDIEAILHSGQYIRELHLRRVVVNLELVEKIIEIIGRRLEKLSIHMNQQDERPVIRLTRILLSAAKHSPNIKELALLGPLMYKQATSQEKKACYRALEVLKNRSPFTATHKIRQFIDGIEEVN